MELDKRIKTITDIKSVTDGCHDWELMNKKGYFANRIVNFTDLSTCAYGEYAEYREHDQCFLCEVDHTYYRYFIPEETLKPAEKQYRPYKNVQELFEDIGVYIGDVIQFKAKADTAEYHSLITGWTENKNGITTICFGYGLCFTMQELFDLFELRSRDEWIPFGIEE